MIRTYGSASSGSTSGLGLAIAKTIGSSFILPSASAGMIPGPERPMNRSMPSITSVGSPVSPSGLEFSAYQRFISDISPAA
jgi:hypothetical protein